MKVLILMGSPRKRGNSAQLIEPFVDELKSNGHEVEIIWTYDLTISPCVACCKCQGDWENYACWQKDDGTMIAEKFLENDLVVLSTPIYGWYCTAPMKALLDRMVCGMCKFYGKEMGPVLWEGTKLALISTCGYPMDKGSDLWIEGMKRYCKHCRLEFTDAITERQKNLKHKFMDDEKEQRIREFARKLNSIT